MFRFSTIVCALAACSALFALAPVAQAAHVSCGEVIAADTTLDNDLVDCPGSGVVIGADGITLDLNGHLIDGVPFQSTNGVDDTAGHDGVTVEDGSIWEFNAGVRFRNVEAGHVEGIDTAAVFSGVLLQYSSRNSIERNSLTSYAAAAELADAARDNSIERNVLSHSGQGVLLKPLEAADNPGPHADLVPRENRIVRNVISENGIGVWAWDGNFNSVERNSISANTDYGALVNFTSSANTLARNDVTGNQIGVAILGQADRNTISDNRVAGSAGDGIWVRADTPFATVVEGNVAGANGDDGIDLDTANAVITRNTANDNSDLGIEAVPGVTDGGGNKARGNGNPAQCLNVRCK